MGLVGIHIHTSKSWIPKRQTPLIISFHVFTCECQHDQRIEIKSDRSNAYLINCHHCLQFRCVYFCPSFSFFVSCLSHNNDSNTRFLSHFTAWMAIRVINISDGEKHLLYLIQFLFSEHDEVFKSFCERTSQYLQYKIQLYILEPREFPHKNFKFAKRFPQFLIKTILLLQVFITVNAINKWINIFMEIEVSIEWIIRDDFCFYFQISSCS